VGKNVTQYTRIERLIEAFENGIENIDKELVHEEKKLRAQQDKVEDLRNEKIARKKVIEAIRDLQAVLPEDQTITISVP
jgi:hypothetical protein